MSEIIMKWIVILCATIVALSPLTAYSDGPWTEVGTHPQAALQPTEWGRTIQTMATYAGRLYFGYGDYGANTGPITIRSWDPETGVFSNEWTSMTECIDTFRGISGRLYAPAIDPRGQAPLAAGYAVGTRDRQWRDDPVYMEHAFDMATLTGDDLWLVGSYGDYHSVALRSMDGGCTWSKELDLFRDGDRASRFYFVFALNGRLYLQSSSDAYSTVFDGAQWQAGPALAHDGRHPVLFAGKIVFQRGFIPCIQGGGALYVFDGTNDAAALSLGMAAWDFAVDNGTLYALQTNGIIQSTQDLENWLPVATAPTNARSLAAMAGRIYIGTTDSKILSSEAAAAQRLIHAECEPAGPGSPPPGVGAPNP